MVSFHKTAQKNDPSLPVTDYTGKPYTDILDWTLEDIDNLPANARKLNDLKQLYNKQHTGNTVPTTVPTSTVTTPAATTIQSTPGSQSHSVADTLASTINTGKSNPSSNNPPPPPRPQTHHQVHPMTVHLMRCLLYVTEQSFPTFDGKDKSHLQSFDDFVARQKLDTTTEFNEIKEYFLMTLHGVW